VSGASNRAETGASRRIERLQPWIAALLSALLHLLCLLVAMLSPTPVVTPPESASSSNWVQVDFIGETQESDQRPPAPPSGTAAADEPADQRPLPTNSRLQSTPVIQADEQARPDPVQRPSVPQPQPRNPRDDSAQRRTQAPAANPPPSTRRRPEAWGQPPGLIVQEVAPRDAGLAPSPTRSRGDSRDPAATEASLEMDGYQVYYDLRSEQRLRAWRDQGMTEVFIPLPGTRRYMVCPLEIALKRDSGKCRPLEPGDPEMEAIGDARQVISVLQVYRRGELVWRGPGPYR